MPFKAGADAVGICQARHNSATDIGAIRKSHGRYPMLHTGGAVFETKTSFLTPEFAKAANASRTLSSFAIFCNVNANSKNDRFWSIFGTLPLFP